ncbi:uncharacterized protein LOC101846320 [Aplysia californica]|uniref:Uncharacterized protein LOC101846320 n=1 Tax=Aplysia californica TaxID=6500 RepID=A0ABM0K8P0_APLCA|nr:uncharacterized protein LOC101846320 [Aplysia californica]
MSMPTITFDVRALILLYKHRPCLWDSSSPDYESKLLRQQALEDILKKLRHQNTNENISLLKKKLQVLEEIYSKQLRQVLKSQKKDPNNVYKPRWIHFKSLDEFLKSQSLQKISTRPRKAAMANDERTATSQSRWAGFGSYVTKSLDILTPDECAAAVKEMEAIISKFVSKSLVRT